MAACETDPGEGDGRARFRLEGGEVKGRIHRERKEQNEEKKTRTCNVFEVEPT